MNLTRAIIGTLQGIPHTLALAEVDTDDLYVVAGALNDACEALIGEALRRLTLAEGQRIATEYRRAHPHADGVPAR